MTKSLQRQVEEMKEANRKLLAENVDLKIQIEKLKARAQSLECVAKLIEGSKVR
jgi:regulator of replication initiation timing